MKIDYQLKIKRLIKYTGKAPDENFVYNEIKDEEYIYVYEDFREALDRYKEKCIESASSIYMPVCFTQQNIVQLLNFEIDGKRRILYQFTCSSI